VFFTSTKNFGNLWKDEFVFFFFQSFLLIPLGLSLVIIAYDFVNIVCIFVCGGKTAKNRYHLWILDYNNCFFSLITKQLILFIFVVSHSWRFSDVRNIGDSCHSISGSRDTRDSPAWHIEQCLALSLSRHRPSSDPMRLRHLLLPAPIAEVLESRRRR